MRVVARGVVVDILDALLHGSHGRTFVDESVQDEAQYRIVVLCVHNASFLERAGLIQAITARARISESGAVFKSSELCWIAVEYHHRQKTEWA